MLFSSHCTFVNISEMDFSWIFDVKKTFYFRYFKRKTVIFCTENNKKHYLLYKILLFLQHEK